MAGSELESLIGSWWRRPEWQLRHVARNLLLDCPGIDQPEHPDLETCGCRLDADAERRLDELAADLAPKLAEIEDRSASWADAWIDIQRQLQTAGRRFRRRSPASSLGDDPRLRMVRYVDCRGVYEHWLYPGPVAGDPGGAHAIEVRRAIEAVLRRGRRHVDWSSMAPTATAGSILLTAPGRVVWVTADDPAPHERPDLAGMTLGERALATLRLAGLPGYDGIEDRREKVGLVAATYAFDPRDLRVPTVLHALDSPYFFPGYRREDHGRVASLGEDFGSPWRRDSANSTVVEWVHENASLVTVQPELELVGFFDE